MNNYWAWFDVDAASGLNAHIRYLVDVLAADSCLYIRCFDGAVEIPVYKRSFKTKSTIVSPLIRTTDVGRRYLEVIRELLVDKDYSLGLRRSLKTKTLNQISVRFSVDDATYPLKIRSVLSIVAVALGKEMPTRVVVGYHRNTFSEQLPGTLNYADKSARLAYELGKKIGSKLGGG